MHKSIKSEDKYDNEYVDDSPPVEVPKAPRLRPMDPPEGLVMAT